MRFGRVAFAVVLLLHLLVHPLAHAFASPDTDGPPLLTRDAESRSTVSDSVCLACRGSHWLSGPSQPAATSPVFVETSIVGVAATGRASGPSCGGPSGRAPPSFQL